MNERTEFSVVCSEMGTHEASLRYSGAMCQSGALAVELQLQSLFGYYKYNRIALTIESPGGELSSLEYVLRSLGKWAKEGRYVAVQSTFQCASAAAFLLSMGEWGERRVDRGTYLLFHSARIAGTPEGMTAAYSNRISNTLNSLDRKLLGVMVDKMLAETGSVKGLSDLVLTRVRYVDANWADLCAQLSTLTNEIDGSRKPQWLKDFLKWARFEAEPKKLVAEMTKYLNLRMQRDVRMDLCEAYVLCLIDEIVDVIDADTVKLEGPKPELVRPLECSDSHIEVDGQAFDGVVPSDQTQSAMVS